MNGNIQTLQSEELEQIFGGVGGLSDNPTIMDLIELAEEAEDVLRWRLGIDGA